MYSPFGWSVHCGLVCTRNWRENEDQVLPLTGHCRDDSVVTETENDTVTQMCNYDVMIKLYINYV